MRSLYKISILILSVSLIINSCKKDKPVPPVLSTTQISNITPTTAVSGGSVIEDGGAPVLSCGVCWNTSDKPDILNNKTADNAGSGSFSSSISQLTPGTSYYVRAYATNSAGTGYGSSVSFKTSGDKPTSTSSNVTEILTTSAKLNGIVNANNLSTTVTFEYGLNIDYGSILPASDSPLTGDSNKNVTTMVTGLNPGKTYHFRIKAENTLGIKYTEDMTFTTLGLVPTVLIQAPTNLKIKAATLNGTVNPNYLPSTVNIEWGTTTDYGNLVTPAQSPVVGNAPVAVTADLSGLTSGTTYHFRVKSTNELGTSYSNDMTFATTDLEWKKSTNFPAVARRLPLSFTYNGKGYYGLGRNSNNPAVENLKDFWRYDPADSSWTRLNDCPYTFMSGKPVKCLVGSILYIAKEWALYSYDLSNDSWHFICSSPISFFTTSCFSIDNKPYFFNNSNSELYEFHPETNTFTRKAATIAGFLNWGLGETFVINNEAFLLHKNDTKIEIYHYLSQSDTWEKKVEKEFSNPEFDQASFIITHNNNVFIGQSCSFIVSSFDDNAIVAPQSPSSNVWKYDYVNNEFKQIASIPGELRVGAGYFSFNTFGSVISGASIDINTHMFRYLNDMWIMAY